MYLLGRIKSVGGLSGRGGVLGERGFAVYKEATMKVDTLRLFVEKHVVFSDAAFFLIFLPHHLPSILPAEVEVISQR